VHLFPSSSLLPSFVVSGQRKEPYLELPGTLRWLKKGDFAVVCWIDYITVYQEPAVGPSMPSPIYERLPQDGGHDSGPSRTEPSRPSTYYGDGPFDPPSSDDESDELLEKNGLRSPGNVERGHLDVEDTEGLTIGGQNQRPSSLRVLIYSLLALVLVAGADIHSGLNTLY
jgi:hypothetical protein